MIKLLSLVIILLTLVFCEGTSLAATIHWKMVTLWTPVINLIESDKHFVKLVDEMSGGRLKISVHPAGELVPASGVFDAISRGSFECGGDWPTYWAGKNTAFDILGAYPMGLSQYDYGIWYYHAGGKAMYDYMYGKHNMVWFLGSLVPSESGIRSRVPIKTLADFKGKKIRMAGKAQGYILKKLGAAQIMMAGGEIYQALQLGTIDGMEFGTPSMDWGMGLAEVTKYNTGPSWHSTGAAIGVTINKDAWSKLPDDLKKIVEYAAAANVSYMSTWYDYGNKEALENFKKAGTQIFKLPAEDLRKIEQYAWEYLLEEAERNPEFLKVAQSMFQYLKDFRINRDLQEPFSQGRNPFTIPNLPGLK